MLLSLPKFLDGSFDTPRYICEIYSFILDSCFLISFNPEQNVLILSFSAFGCVFLRGVANVIHHFLNASFFIPYEFSFISFCSFGG